MKEKHMSTTHASLVRSGSALLAAALRNPGGIQPQKLIQFLYLTDEFLEYLDASDQALFQTLLETRELCGRLVKAAPEVENEVYDLEKEGIEALATYVEQAAEMMALVIERHPALRFSSLFSQFQESMQDIVETIIHGPPTEEPLWEALVALAECQEAFNLDHLKLAPGLAIPLDDIVGRAIRIAGTRRSGKTTLGIRLAEFLGRHGASLLIPCQQGEYLPLIGLFPRGLIIGAPASPRRQGTYAEVPFRPVGPEDAYAFGQTLLAEGLQVILDVSSYQNDEASQILANCIHGMLDWNVLSNPAQRVPCHVFLEEANSLLPARQSDSRLHDPETRASLLKAFTNMVDSSVRCGIAPVLLAQCISQIDRHILAGTVQAISFLLHQEQGADLEWCLQHIEKTTATRTDLTSSTAGQGIYLGVNGEQLPIGLSLEELADAYIERGDHRFDTGDYQGAANDYLWALRYAPQSADASLNLTSAYILLGELEKSLRECEHTLLISPENAHAHFHAGNTFVEMKKHADAVNAFSRAIACKADYAAAYGNRANTLGCLGKYEEARNDYQQAFLLAPEDSNHAWMWTWVQFRKDGLSGGHVLALEQVASLDPEDYISFVARAVIALHHHDSRLALEYLEQAAHIEPEQWDPPFWQAMAWAMHDEPEKAQRALETALEMGLPPLLLTPLYWLQVGEHYHFFDVYARSLLLQFEI